MSVDKFIITKDDANFVIIPNVICQTISDPEALGLYVYLVSLPPQWEFYKTVIRKHFNWGRDKLDKKLSILKSHNLIEPIPHRNTKGQYEDWRLHVKDGRDYIQNPIPENQNTDFQYSGELSTGLDKNSTHNTENTAAVKSVTGFDTPINTTFQKEKKKSFCASAQKKATALEKAAPEKTAAPKTASPKTKEEWREENAKRHDFADKMDNAVIGKQQMENEAKHIAEHEEIKRTPMPESLRSMIQNMKRGMGVGSHDHRRV